MKTWFITGVSRGLGKALAEAAFARGDTVLGTVRDGTPEVATGPGTLHVITLEITDPAGVKAAIDEALARHVPIDVIVNNAGYGLLGAIEEATPDETARLFDVNVFGPLRLIQAALRHLRAQGSGHIINVTSIAGRAPMASSGVYAAAKSAMEGLSQSLAQEVAPFGIKVTAVAPGGFRTDFVSDHSIRRSGAGASDAYAETVGAALAHLGEIAGRQIGDPGRGAAAIIAAVDADQPPLQLLLGSDALRRTREKLANVTREMDAWAPVTLGTDFPKETDMETNTPASWSLRGRVAIVTGAARGIGRATALLLAERGATVVATDLNDAVHDLAGDGVATLIGDVSTEDMAKRTVALATERFDGLDILVNNAGRTLNKPLLDTSVADWDAIMATNARGDFIHAREAVRAMLARGGGAIVNVASVVAMVAMKDMTAYASSKGAIAQLTKVIAVEHGRDGIRANAVGVGVVETDILEGIVDDSRATLASYGDAHPIGRVAQPAEIAEVIAFLASSASSFITGTLVMADGGYTAL